MTISELITLYRRTAGDGTRREDARHAQWWRDNIGHRPLSDLTTQLILVELDHLASYGRSPSTVNFYLRFFRRVCAWGALVAYLPTDPCAGMALHKEPTPTLRVLTEEEEAKLCAALGPPYSLWIKLAIESGLKQSEQFTLRWRDVDLERADLLLPHANAGAVSLMRLSLAAVTILRQLKQLQTPSMWVFPDANNPSRPVNIHAFYVGRWITALQKAGIPHCAWKDLRHTCGVRLAKQGLSVNDIVGAMRQSENRHAYIYRAIAANRPTKTQRTTTPPTPVFTELSDGELKAVMLRDLQVAPLTFDEGVRLYAVHHLKNRPARSSFDRMYRQFWLPWAERRMDTLTRKEIRAWYLGIGHTPGHANRALSFLRSLYNWASNVELIPTVNPAVGIRRFPSYARERFLDGDEASRVMNGLPLLPKKTRAYLLILLFTGCRMSEARCMQWADVDETTRLWKKGRTKTGTSHYLPLPVQAIDALRCLPRTSEWIFPGKQKGHPWSRASAEKTWGAIRRRWGLEDVRLHDFRRTCASLLSIEGENLPTIQNVLNHSSLTHTSIYARLNTKAVDRALQAQADRLSALVLPSSMEMLDAPMGNVGGMQGRPLVEIIEAADSHTVRAREDEPGEDGPVIGRRVPPCPMPPARPMTFANPHGLGMEWPG